MTAAAVVLLTGISGLAAQSARPAPAAHAATKAPPHALPVAPTAKCRSAAPPAQSFPTPAWQPRRIRAPFVRERGGPRGAFRARVGHGSIWITSTGVLFDMVASGLPREGRLRQRTEDGFTERVVVPMRFLGVNPARTLSPSHKVVPVSLHLASHRERTRGHEAITYNQLWDGVDLRVSATDDQVRHRFLAKDQRALERIRISLDGAAELRIRDDGSLVARIGSRTFLQAPPRAAGATSPKALGVRYTRLTGRTYAIRLTSPRAHRGAVALTLPVTFSTLLGGSDADQVLGVTVDAQGDAYVVGGTHSHNFPTKGAIQERSRGNKDAFIAKIDPTSGELEYASYIGGGGLDEAYEVRVDAAGAAYVAGRTSSPDFPVKGALQPRLAGSSDGFILKLGPSGSQLIYSTYFGGSEHDSALWTALDGAGNVYFGGRTRSTNLPTLSPLQAANGGDWDAYVAKIDPSGARLLYSTYLGGSRQDEGWEAEVDQAGNTYLVGITASSDFPTARPITSSYRGGPHDAFVAKLSTSGTTLLFSTYIGGSADDSLWRIVLDNERQVYLAGATLSKDFPAPNGLQSRSAGGTDGIVAKLNAAGSVLVYASYLGGSGEDEIHGLGIDSARRIAVTGFTRSADFPVRNAMQQRRGGGADAFYTRFSPLGNELEQSTYLGGARDEKARAINVAADGTAIVLGDTRSPDFPLTANAFQRSLASSNVFLTRFGGRRGTGQADARPYVWTDIVGHAAIRRGVPASFTVMFGNSGGREAVGVPLWIAGIPADAVWELDIAVDGPQPTTARQRSLIDGTAITVQRETSLVLPLLIKSIPAGATGSFTLTLTVSTDRTFRLRTWADAPYFGSPMSPAAKECLTELIGSLVQEVFGAALPYQCKLAIDDLAGRIFDRLPENFFTKGGGEQRTLWSTTKFWVAVLSTVATCAQEIIPAARLPELISTAIKLVQSLEASQSKAQACVATANGGNGTTPGGGVSGGAGPGQEFTVDTRGSFDPNEKLGARGHGRQRYVAGIEPLRYVIFFENLRTASAPARDIVVHDRLPAGLLDLGTLTLGSVTVGKRSFVPTPGATSLDGSIDLRPSQRMIVRISASVDASNGVLTWRLSAIDPATGGPPADPIAGFLPPNRTPPEGEGHVVLTIKPRANLPNGTRIVNRAEIIFDRNDPLATTWANVVDRTLPASRVSSVTARRPGGPLTVRWSGRDPNSGVRRFDVYVSENGGQYRPWLRGTSRRTQTFRGRFGRQYAFLTVAADRVGNFERQPAIGDAAGPARRIRRSGRLIVLAGRIFVLEPTRLAVSVRDRRTGRTVRLQRGSTIGARTLGAATTKVLVSAARRGPFTIRLRVRPPRVDRANYEIHLHTPDMAREPLKLRYRE